MLIPKGARIAAAIPKSATHQAWAGRRRDRSLVAEPNYCREERQTYNYSKYQLRSQSKPPHRSNEAWHVRQRDSILLLAASGLVFALCLCSSAVYHALPRSVG